MFIYLATTPQERIKLNFVLPSERSFVEMSFELIEGPTEVHCDVSEANFSYAKCNVDIKCTKSSKYE